jgi:DNA-3-methyladenine glycosylase
MPRLPRRFFARPTLVVARELLGQRLVHVCGGQRLTGLITETEAYIGQDDLACHARHGRTSRAAVMFGPPGHAYVYFTYGMHWMLNAVTEAEDCPAAVLIRAIMPEAGLKVMRVRRGRDDPPGRLTNGPAKITQALGIDHRLNGQDLCARRACLFVEQGATVPDAQVRRAPRVGLGNTPEPWLSLEWNFQWQATPT